MRVDVVLTGDGGEVAHTADELLQLLVARRVGIEANAVEIGRDQYGRPVVHSPTGELHVTVSYGYGYTVCAVANSELGIDIEGTDRIEADEALADRVCTVLEREQLRCTPAAQRRRALVRLWARKEAFAKALGVGLGLEFATLDTSREIPVISGVPQRGWTLVDLRGPVNCCLALAVRAGSIRVETETLDRP